MPDPKHAWNFGKWLLKPISKYWNILKLLRITLWSKYWFINSKDAKKREICMILFAFSHQYYNNAKPRWWPAVTPPKAK